MTILAYVLSGLSLLMSILSLIHLFDLIFLQINPAAHSAMYDVDRFLALRVSSA